MDFVFIIGYGDDYCLVPDILQMQEHHRDLLSDLVAVVRQAALSLQVMAARISEAVLALKDISAHK